MDARRGEFLEARQRFGLDARARRVQHDQVGRLMPVRKKRFRRRVAVRGRCPAARLKIDFEVRSGGKIRFHADHAVKSLRQAAP